MPSEDLPGEDLPGMQRYPGAVRVKYESHLLGDERVTEAGYLAQGEVGAAAEFYEPKLDENGWVFQGSDFDAGERVLLARRGEAELLVELEQQSELVEIEIEISETLPNPVQ